MDALTDYLAGFGEDPGYLDFAAFGPLSAAVLAESAAQQEALRRGRHGLMARLDGNVDRLRAAAAAVTGFRSDQVVFQPNTTQGLTQAVYGVTGGILVSPAEYPSLPVAAVRASEHLHATAPIWLETDQGRVTPGGIRDQLTSTTTAVAVSAVDARTGYVADIEGIRQVIGDRLLIVDAVQALGAVDVPWTAADVVACGGQKWLRAGYGAAFLAVSDRAAERLTPVLSGVGGTQDPMVWDAVPEPAAGASALQLDHPDRVAAARLAAALEDLADAGPAAVAARVAEHAARVIALADETGVPVVSPRSAAERAGIVVLEPEPNGLTPLTAALFNHGVSVTIRQNRIRIAPHAGTGEETFGMLRAAPSCRRTRIEARPMTGLDTGRTLYVSDLDDTLLAKDGRISAESARILDELIADGLCFTVATARSYASARRGIGDLGLQLPLVVYSGATAVDPLDDARLWWEHFDGSVVHP